MEGADPFLRRSRKPRNLEKMDEAGKTWNHRIPEPAVSQLKEKEPREGEGWGAAPGGTASRWQRGGLEPKPQSLQ